jgi:hypothetical protein
VKFLWPYKGTCFGHVMSKACKYAINDDKVSMNLNLVCVEVLLLNHIVQAMFTILDDGLGGLIFKIEENDTNIFGVGMSMEKSLLAFLIRKLSIFWK